MVGFIPFENIVGKASFIFFSTNGHARLYELWKWPTTIRYSRLFRTITPVRTLQSQAEPMTEKSDG
jgi:signal peptidase I